MRKKKTTKLSNKGKRGTMLPVTTAAAGTLAVRILPPSATSAFLFPASPPPHPAPSKITLVVPQPPLSFSTRSLFCCRSNSTPSRGAGRSSVSCEAASEPSELDQTVYQGVYGPWTVEPSDVREVIFYRSGLVTSAASFVIASSAAFLPERNAVGDIIKHNIDYFLVTGAGGLGLSLLLIHIYITPIKRFLQALWVIGAFGSVGSYLMLARPLNESLVNYVIDNPVVLWFVGPLFAALTGLVFKEGLCYGKLEAGILTFVIPGLLLGHMTGLVDNGAKLSLLGVWMALFVVFAARKFQQPIKDDIGDKSIFMFNALPEEEKEALKRDKQLD